MKTLQTTTALTLLLLVAALFAPAAQAQGTNAFMYYPYFGPAKGLNSYFDHQYPNYSKNGSTLIYTGASTAYSYDGHSGIDYALQYEPVLASAGGTVGYAGWAAANHESGLGLMSRVDHTNYRSYYGHLSAVVLQTGAAVSATNQVGTGGTTGNSSGPHLHFEVARNVSGTYYVVDPYGWTGGYTDPWNASTGAVSQYLFYASPTVAAPPTYSVTVVDDINAGFSRWCNAGSGASCPYWYYSGVYGHGGSMWWTYSNGAVADYRARWTPSLPAAANYDVQVHIPNYNATSHAARYFIQYNGGSRTVVVDQHDTYGPGNGSWLSLGRYPFAAGSAGYVEVSDATYIGSYTESGTAYRLGVDAAQFVRN